MGPDREGALCRLPSQRSIIDMFRRFDVAVDRAAIMAAFGCNFEGDIPVARVLDLVAQIFELASEHGLTIRTLSLSDTMAWATPMSVRRVVGAVRDRHPQLEIALQLHDTRGMGIANAYAGLDMGVATFDAAVAGLGGCPFGRRRQRVHRGPGLHVPRDGDRDRRRPRGPAAVGAARGEDRGPEGCTKPGSCRGLVIFVQQTAQEVPPTHVRVHRGGHRLAGSSGGDNLTSGLLTWAQKSMQHRAPRTPG
jgi:hypothetical protein